MTHPGEDPVERAAAAVAAAIRECMDEQREQREQRERMSRSLAEKLKVRGRHVAEG